MLELKLYHVSNRSPRLQEGMDIIKKISNWWSKDFHYTHITSDKEALASIVVLKIVFGRSNKTIYLFQKSFLNNQKYRWR